MVDTFTGWIESFPTQTEKAEEVETTKQTNKKQKNCSIKSFHDLVCPGHYKVTVGHHFLLRLPEHWVPKFSKALVITTYRYYAWSPQSSGKVEIANKFLK